MRTLLVATDYSDAAANAVDHAAALCRTLGAQLTLFNVHKLNIHASNAIVSTTTVDEQFAKSKERLSAYAGEVGARHGMEVDWVLGKDDPVQALGKYTAHHPVDLVVMGIESDLAEYKLLGNTTTDAIKLMQFPLLVVPNGARFKGIHKVMYACEPAHLRTDHGLDVLRWIVQGFGATLDVFHVVTHDAEKEKAEMERVMEPLLHDLPHAYRYGQDTKVGNGILAGLAGAPADLLVMIPHRLGFFEMLTKGSHTGQMTVRTHIPLLVIPSEPGR